MGRWWDAVITPHALFLAATSAPEKYRPILAKFETLGSGGTTLYQEGAGFLDGYHVKGDYQGQVVPVLISQDQGMIAMSLVQIRASDRLTPSVRALLANGLVHARLVDFYTQLERKLRR